jgi:hypothetical protein
MTSICHFQQPSPDRLARGMGLVLAAATGLLAGCVAYPVHKMLQPHTEVTVRDGTGRPLAGVSVHLVTRAHPPGMAPSRATQATDAAGQAGFPRVSEWRAETLALHGAQAFYWNLCIRHPGFVTHETAYSAARQFDARPVVTLSPGDSRPCGDGD